jgi:hypothetical protein
MMRRFAKLFNLEQSSEQSLRAGQNYLLSARNRLPHLRLTQFLITR